MNSTRTSKTMPLDRTLVFEFATFIGEVTRKKPGPRGSIAKRMSRTSQFVNGDVTLDPVVPTTIEGIEVAVMLHAYRSFKIALTIGGVTTPYTECSGLFVHFGKIERIDILADGEAERMVYIRS